MSVDDSPTRSEFQQRFDTARNMVTGGAIAFAVALGLSLLNWFAYGEADFLSYVILIIGAVFTVAGAVKALRLAVESK